MPVKTRSTYDVLEETKEFVNNLPDEASEHIGKTIKTVANDVSAQTSFSAWLGLPESTPDEVIKAKEDEELMWDLEGFKQAMREIDTILGKTTDETALSEDAQKFIEDRRKNLTRSLSGMKQEHRTEASTLGVTLQGEQQEAQEKQQKKVAKEQEEQQEEEEKKANLEIRVEAPQGIEKSPSLFAKLRRKMSPFRAIPRATAKLRRNKGAEINAGRGVGG